MINFERLIKKRINTIWAFFIVFFDFFISRICCIKNSSCCNKKLVLVTRLDRIGDFILWLSAAEHLRGIYPSSEYEVVLYGNCLWSALAEKIPYWDRVEAINTHSLKRNLRYRFKIIRQIRSSEFAIAINPIFSRSFFIDDSLIRASHSEKRIGQKGDKSNISHLLKNISDRWYTHLLSDPIKAPTEIEKNLAFVNQLSGNKPLNDLPSLEIKNFNSPTLIPENQDYFVICPGAGDQKRCWPADFFCRIIDDTFEKFHLKGVLCGPESELPMGKKIQNSCVNKVINLVSLTNLEQFILLISKARFVLANESAGIHIASALRIPSICVLGGGHFGRFLPYPEYLKAAPESQLKNYLPKCAYNKMDCYGCNWECIYNIGEGEPFPCVKNVSENQVMDFIQEILDIH